MNALEVKDELEIERKQIREQKNEIMKKRSAKETSYKDSLMLLQEQVELERKNSELMNTIEAEMKIYIEDFQNNTEIANTKNRHNTYAVLNDVLENILYEVNRQIPRETYKDIDNTPKQLIHMTEEDLQSKSPAVLREELNELIKEAKTKIKPVQMSEEDREKYIQPLEDLNENKDLIK